MRFSTAAWPKSGARVYLSRSWKQHCRTAAPISRYIHSRTYPMSCQQGLSWPPSCPGATHLMLMYQINTRTWRPCPQAVLSGPRAYAESPKYGRATRIWRLNLYAVIWTPAWVNWMLTSLTPLYWQLPALSVSNYKNEFVTYCLQRTLYRPQGRVR